MGARKKFKVSDLTSRPVPEQRQALEELVRDSRSLPNGEVTELDAKIRAYEDRFGFDSKTLLERVKSGEQRETWDICQWMMTLELRDSIAAKRPAPPR